MSSRSRTRLFTLSALNAGVMLLITFVWLGLPYTFGDEGFFIKWTALSKKSLLGIDPKPPPESVLLVDLAESKTVIEQANEFGEVSPYHRMVVTDRTHLAEFLEMIAPHREEVKLVVLDVLLDRPTSQDSLLQAKVDALGDKLIGITHLESEEEALESVITFRQRGVATYRAAQGMFLKYPLLLGDTLPTVPLKMYELMEDDPLDHSGLFFGFKRGISLRNPIVDYKVRLSDIRVGTNREESNFTVWNMGSILEFREFMPEEERAAFFRDRMVLIGDFSQDVHTTPFGRSPGLLLIYNAYLTLVDGNNIVSFFWVLLLFFGYLLISWRVFNDLEFTPPKWISTAMDSRMGRWMLDTVDDAFFLILLTILSYFLFNIHINILILLLYLKLIEFLWNRYFVNIQSLPHENAII